LKRERERERGRPLFRKGRVIEEIHILDPDEEQELPSEVKGTDSARKFRNMHLLAQTAY
jgi:hypothetical protein